jgi:hypothetical protein
MYERFWTRLCAVSAVLSVSAVPAALPQGAECFPVFMKSGLDKALLKRMWDLVAGNAGTLNAEQFFKCMYLMDGCRRGAQLPAALPPGPWPQVSRGCIHFSWSRVCCWMVWFACTYGQMQTGRCAACSTAARPLATGKACMRVLVESTKLLVASSVDYYVLCERNS